MPGNIQSISHILIYLILPATLWNYYNCYIHFTGKKTEKINQVFKLNNIQDDGVREETRGEKM